MGAIGAGRAGAVRRALQRALEEARDAERMSTEHELLAVLAERYAAVVDRAAGAGDEAGLLRAGDKLVELLSRLPVRVEVAKGGAADDGDDDGGGGRGFLRVLDGEPQVGDAAHA